MNYSARLKKIIYDESGQFLVYILAAIVVASVVTFGVAYRSLSSTKKTSVDTRSAQALYSAESCAEVALSLSDDDLEDLSGDPPTELDLTGDGVNDCSYAVSLDGGTNSLTPFTIEKDEVREIDLNGYGTGDITISWDTTPAQDAILVVRTISQTGGNYTVASLIYDGNDTVSCGTYAVGAFSAPDPGSGAYAHSFTFTPGNTAKLLRIMALCTSTTVFVQGQNNFPAQGYVINASGTNAGAIRKIQVVRGHPQLPAIFDYALFSKSGSAPLSK